MNVWQLGCALLCCGQGQRDARYRGTCLSAFAKNLCPEFVAVTTPSGEFGVFHGVHLKLLVDTIVSLQCYGLNMCCPAAYQGVKKWEMIKNVESTQHNKSLKLSGRSR